jgi:hypothetical protein
LIGPLGVLESPLDAARGHRRGGGVLDGRVQHSTLWLRLRLCLLRL